MRVLIDALIAPGDPRGVGRYVRQLAGSLAAIDDVQVLIAIGRWHASFFGPLARRGVELVPVGLPSGGRLSRHAWHATRMAPLTRRRRADVVHVPDRVPAMPTSGPPLVVTMHDIAEYEQPDAFGFAQGRFRRFVLDRQLRVAGRLIVPSAFTASRLALLDPGSAARTTLVPIGPGIDLAIAPRRPDAAIEQPFLLCLGALQRHKNLPRVIRAFQRLSTRAISLVVAGEDHNDRGPVAEVIGGDSRIVRLRRPSDPEVAWLYGHASGLVFASLYEGFGLPILEAMAFSCPVITSDRGAMAELGEGAALLVDPLDEEDLRHAMVRLLEDAVLVAELRAAGRERAARFTWERAAADTLSVYRIALGMPAREVPSSLGPWHAPPETH